MTKVEKKAAAKKGTGATLEFNHAMIYTSRLPEALKFYRDALGFEMVETYPAAYARLKSPAGSTTIALHAVEPGQRMDATSEGLRLYLEVQDLDAFCKALVKKRVKLDQMPKDMPWGWRHAYLRDPDGHQISLYWAGEARFQNTLPAASGGAVRRSARRRVGRDAPRRK
jgi:catechol 2,3-dioxygenase-like lactoylglutathione lyase family enzyme